MSSYEQKNPADISIDELVPAIKRYLKEVTKKQINFIYHGTYNVFEISSQFILRVPDIEFRNKEGLDLIKNEYKILNFLRDKLPLKTPTILNIHESEELPFIIAEKIPGVSLENIIMEISDEKKVKLGKKIGEFLNVLHSNALLQGYFKFHLKNIHRHKFTKLPKTLGKSGS
ncbi:MAG: phosphotransferase [Candidatus Heimdallarchaeota archaeon]|nr:phosphotransferase [Candidatus Heimdallarchaeota archaeon]